MEYKDRFIVQYINQEGMVGREIKPLLIGKPKLNIEALSEYFTFQNIFSDLTLFDGIRLIRPPHDIWKFTPNELMDFDKAQWIYITTLQDAIYREMETVEGKCAVALSGGTDSASVLAGLPPDFDCSTVSVYFHTDENDTEHHFDESERIIELVNKFGRPHISKVVSPTLMYLPSLIYLQEDLRVGMSYANLEVYRQCLLNGITDLFLGNGGDELFGGYPWRYNKSFGQYIRLINDFDKSWFFKIPVPPAENKLAMLMNELPLSVEDNNMHQYLLARTLFNGCSIVDQKLAYAHGIKLHLPYLSKDLFDWAMTVPFKFKSDGTTGKMLPRSALSRYLPKSVITAPKQGFASPDVDFYKGNVVWDFLTEERTLDRGIINPDAIRHVLIEHKVNGNKKLLIWSLLSFETWCRIFLD